MLAYVTAMMRFQISISTHGPNFFYLDETTNCYNLLYAWFMYFSIVFVTWNIGFSFISDTFYCTYFCLRCIFVSFTGASGPVSSAALADPSSITAITPVLELWKGKKVLENSGRTYPALVTGCFLLTREVPTRRMINKKCLFWIDTWHARWIYISTSLTANVHSLCRENRILQGPRKRKPIHFHRTIHR